MINFRIMHVSTKRDPRTPKKDSEACVPLNPYCPSCQLFLASSFCFAEHSEHSLKLRSLDSFLTLIPRVASRWTSDAYVCRLLPAKKETSKIRLSSSRIQDEPITLVTNGKLPRVAPLIGLLLYDQAAEEIRR
jgi:hypothetical protein